ncbi:MAG: adenylate/guanylate cyclase domain-containing protein [Ignavibacteriales bacterium]|nr:adenylate/guanylate cyclase domain-containing protein [Ignavibacteriales bacterium]
MNSQSIKVSRKIVLQVPRMALWQFLADTDRLNKLVGLPAIDFTPLDNILNKGYYHARAKLFGIQIKYVELPYEWVDGEFYRIVRQFNSKLIHEIGVDFRFRSLGDETQFELEIQVSPRTTLTKFIAKVVLAKVAFKDVFSAAKAFQEQYIAPNQTSLPSYENIYTIQEPVLRQRLETLTPFSLKPTVIKNLQQHLLKGSDIDVVRMLPFELADLWKEDRYETLKTFIASTKAGILDLHWTVLCPNCRGVTSDTMTLAELKAETHCDTCNINYGVDLASSIEARFTVHPSIRLARNETYCIGGPANTPHIITQLRLQSGETRNESLYLKSGLIRARSYQTKDIYNLHVADSSLCNFLSVDCNGNHLSVSAIDLQSGNVSLSITNRMNSEVLFIIERESWRENAATAALVTSLQDFRDLFPAEAVAPGAELGIASIAVLFTDLRGSTALYSNIGDTKAFGFVQDHFRYLTESVSHHHGGILKTMGDAIMASFASGTDALAAAIEMQTEWKKFTQAYGSYENVELKIGIHEGSAIAINNKGKLDYFGTTVNIAGRLQKYSHGSDIIITEQLVPEETRELLLTTSNYSVERFSAELKGLEHEKFNLLRVVFT